ncbi:DUF3095 domain-containing protein [Marinospirillum perlucidum]|uniref:DUF3095 domain-containing protein n=1 Tax=Marinospirillum perlucidum TaxID=1982602 RepID=UPI000DF304EE|nr:DUF3095 domain-containing protein [Marinospirillum perlucidum]
MSSDQFYMQLPALQHFAEVLDASSYQELPEDWLLVITDVQGSTSAIAEGRYQDINALGGCTVAAVLNAVKPLDIPYIFGGDGASFCIPPSCEQQVRQALLGCVQLAEESMNLKLRAGLVPYRDIKASSPLLVCRYHRAGKLHQAIFADEGLQRADYLLKRDKTYHVQSGEGPAAADFTGFECRWQRVPSPREVTVSLLVEVLAPSLEEKLECYRDLLERMQKLFGDEQTQQPLSIAGVRLSFDRDKLISEARARRFGQSGSFALGLEVWKLRLINLIGWLLMSLKIRLGRAHWGDYKKDLLLRSDFRKFDGVFRSVFAADNKALKTFQAWLDQEQLAGRLNYGMHTSNAAQLTCLVSQAGIEHVHFVDGCDGGYALAAAQLKQQQSKN